MLEKAGCSSNTQIFPKIKRWDVCRHGTIVDAEGSVSQSGVDPLQKLTTNAISL